MEEVQFGKTADGDLKQSLVMIGVALCLFQGNTCQGKTLIRRPHPRPLITAALGSFVIMDDGPNVPSGQNISGRFPLLHRVVLRFSQFGAYFAVLGGLYLLLQSLILSSLGILNLWESLGSVCGKVPKYES